jgi:hypothetical protein
MQKRARAKQCEEKRKKTYQAFAKRHIETQIMKSLDTPKVQKSTNEKTMNSKSDLFGFRILGCLANGSSTLECFQPQAHPRSF